MGAMSIVEDLQPVQATKKGNPVLPSHAAHCSACILLPEVPALHRIQLQLVAQPVPYNLHDNVGVDIHYILAVFSNACFVSGNPFSVVKV